MLNQKKSQKEPNVGNYILNVKLLRKGIFHIFKPSREKIYEFNRWLASSKKINEDDYQNLDYKNDSLKLYNQKK